MLTFALTEQSAVCCESCRVNRKRQLFPDCYICMNSFFLHMSTTVIHILGIWIPPKESQHKPEGLQLDSCYLLEGPWRPPFLPLSVYMEYCVGILLPLSTYQVQCTWQSKHGNIITFCPDPKKTTPTSMHEAWYNDIIKVLFYYL